MYFPASANAGNTPPKCNKPTLSSLPLPDDISVICLAYVPRCDHPSLSEVCKTFNQIIAASSELNRVRSLHKSTENVLYLALRFSRDQKPIWYTLNQKPSKEESNSLNHKLVPYPSFPCLPCWGSNVIVIGQEMYVLGGCIDGELTTNAFAIDCITRTCRSLPSMRVARGCAAFGVVDEKIYVLGGCNKKKSSKDWLEVFDLKNQTWESFPGVCNKNLHEITLNSFVMNEKIYIMDRERSFVYDPKKNKWERQSSLNSEWVVGSCVIDYMLYTFGFEKGISVYDPKARTWRILKGVGEDLPDMRGIQGGSRMANHGGKLVILFKRNERGETKIWCTEIALERRGQGEHWGKVLWSNIVASFKNSPTIVQCLDVII
ncbi:hypothetical protein Bca4012_078743 [Brassica carinata]|uniref:BnaC07g24830D protein n=6 Tax=Brassica TaxID=3705 RepID=A0A078I0P5_BRANA|nr:PREDICTED: putative F-box/kelch-repeat protein At3g27910 [Brassica oleracea var. oleracea]XP_022561253.2 putative F-box/kelch-repeat protein At3g27910 [Brassica napus]KAF3485693.1 hypothetical protein F2Q69_00056039 [Brassica cretica]KAG2264164.1 hypothetical protein Bca52824_071243 [Brassica carinata]VDD38660.1 unnamed protein product [Brassica oleracea]KAH0869826.1 hypothetical protein HID58_076848 [Brassica napus]CAF2006606.1 unnamed protein product [Brassica napus]